MEWSNLFNMDEIWGNKLKKCDEFAFLSEEMLMKNPSLSEEKLAKITCL
jgi:hypothetical protein